MDHGPASPLACPDCAFLSASSLRSEANLERRLPQNPRQRDVSQYSLNGPAAAALAAGIFGVATSLSRPRAGAKQRLTQCRAEFKPANLLERSSLEAGAKLLEEAVKASDSGSPTRFANFSQEKNRQSYVSKQAAAEGDATAVDEDGLPLVYSVDRIAKFWDTKPGELAERWSRFLRISTPFITRFFYSLLNGRLWEDEASLASQAVDNMQELGPTFIKLGQVLSIRPDVLPPASMKELARLQDGISNFSNTEARAVIEKALGQPIDKVFSSFSEKPVAAASLAQVYRATVKETGEEVAVKVQRPGALATVSKDLYVLRRLADVTQPLIRRFTADETDYIALTETFAEGLYTELDFQNEALNAIRMETLLSENCSAETMERIVIPAPLMSLTSRHVMVSRWVNGVKLSTLPQNEIKDLIAIGQEVFLTQLLDIGFFHGDPHPGNLLKIIDGPDEGKLCLLDFGLVAQVPREDRDIIVSAVVHLGTQNWEGLIDDFVRLGFLAEDTDSGALIPILQRVLGPYLKGGGAQSMKNANFQALSQDLLKVNLEVRFSIPPYVSLLARSVATLEGVALQGDSGYQIVAEAYPFVVRKLLKNENRLSFSALRELLYDPATKRLRPQRLSTMLQASLGVVADTSRRAGFIDFDAAPAEGAPLSEVLAFLLSPSSKNLRPLLNAELCYGLDLFLRRAGRQLRLATLELLVPRVPFLGIRLPQPPAPPLFVPIVGFGDDAAQPSFKIMQAGEAFDAALPELTTAEDVDLATFREAVEASLLDGEELPDPSPEALLPFLQSALAGDRKGTADFAEALRQILTTEQTRNVLTQDVVLEVASELLRTWRARLEEVP